MASRRCSTCCCTCSSWAACSTRAGRRASWVAAVRSRNPSASFSAWAVCSCPSSAMRGWSRETRACWDSMRSREASSSAWRRRASKGAGSAGRLQRPATDGQAPGGTGAGRGSGAGSCPIMARHGLVRQCPFRLPPFPSGRSASSATQPVGQGPPSRPPTRPPGGPRSRTCSSRPRDQAPVRPQAGRGPGGRAVPPGCS